MAGPVEEIGSTTRSFMSAMGSQPVMLGMVIVVLAMIGMLWFTLRFAAEARKNEFEMIFKQQAQVTELLSRCTVNDAPRPRSEYKLQSDDSHIVELPPLRPLPTE
jgi:cytoskeletal protein RodZ